MNERVVLITGASSGIGETIATDLAADHHLAISSSDEARIRAAAKRIEVTAADAVVSSLRIDVTDPESVQRGIEVAIQTFGRIDVLVNCAGIAGGGSTVDMPLKEWQRVLDVNLTGVFLTTQWVLRLGGMLSRKWGRIINIASTGGKQGVMHAAAYSASKHGVVGFTKSLGLELAKTGVTVNAICPGFVETKMAVGARARYAAIWNCSETEAKQRIEARVPLGRYVLPAEVSGLVRYLVSDASGAVVAQAINVCGGLGNY